MHCRKQGVGEKFQGGAQGRARWRQIRDVGPTSGQGHSSWIKEKDCASVENAVSVRGQHRSRRSQESKQRQHEPKLRKL